MCCADLLAHGAPVACTHHMCGALACRDRCLLTVWTLCFHGRILPEGGQGVSRLFKSQCVGQCLWGYVALGGQFLIPHRMRLGASVLLVSGGGYLANHLSGQCPWRQPLLSREQRIAS